jgi:exonuclease 3'-5' domain-containing protein 1
VRNDSDALFSLYGIKIKTVYDIQLLEVAFRRSKNLYSKTVKGLGNAVLEYVKPGPSWAEVKEAGKRLLFPTNGGSYELFEKRPLDQRILEYAANDVALLFALVAVLGGRLGGVCAKWRERVLKASSNRVSESHQIDYNPDGNNRGLSPKF